MARSSTDEILNLNQQLLDSIAAGDWETYERLCDPKLTAFEPEAMGQLVEGMKFHQFYFAPGKKGTAPTMTMCSPHVRALGDVAILAYVRLTQRVTADGGSTVSHCEETRVWQKQNGEWKHIHFHRSVPTVS